MKRGILYLQMKYNEQALEDFNNLCDHAEKEAMTQTPIQQQPPDS